MSKNTSLKTLNESSEPVYFLEISVENVRCFGEKQTLDLSDGKNKPARWTVILGDNGTGKTTLLRCITALEMLEIKLENQPRPKYGYTPKGFDLKYNFHISKPFKIQTSRVYVGYIANVGKLRNFSDFPFGITENRHKKPLTLNYTQFYSTLFAYGASRRMGKGSLVDTNNSDATSSLFSDEVSLINAEEWLLQAIFAYQNAEGETKKYAQNRYEKIRQMLLTLLPDIEELRIKPIAKDQLKAAIQVQTPYGWVDMSDLSLGYQASIAWMVDLACRLLERYPDSDNPLEEPAIVLIDEIDLHLHPKWQRTLISSLTEIFKQTQFIVTAHSPLIVQSAKDANIVLLKREGDQVKIYNNKETEAIQGWRVDQILTSDLFEIPSARPPEYDDYLQRREKLLAKKRLTKKDKQELETIGKKLDELPIVPQSTKESEAIEILRKAADIFKARVKP